MTRRKLLQVGSGVLAMSILAKFSDLKNLAGQRQPVLFVGHGSPMNIISENQYTRALRALGKELSEPKAILVISAHWLTQGTQVHASSEAKTIYDFYGFPEELYKYSFSVPGSPEVAALIGEKIPMVQPSNSWGLDHGSWSVLTHLIGNRQIPTLQLSLNRNLTLKQHFELAKELAFLRDRGVLIIGSGNIVHNLYEIDWQPEGQPRDWALEFDALIEGGIKSRNFSMLNDITDPSFKKLLVQSHPTLEHLIPLAYILGLVEETDQIQQISKGIQNASVSMTSYLVHS